MWSLVILALASIPLPWERTAHVEAIELYERAAPMWGSASGCVIAWERCRGVWRAVDVLEVRPWGARAEQAGRSEWACRSPLIVFRGGERWKVYYRRGCASWQSADEYPRRDVTDFEWRRPVFVSRSRWWSWWEQ